MQRIEKIVKHPLLIKQMRKNAESETNRTFCKHDLSHALDVARIAQLMNLEQSLSLEKELVYAMALLHDITKWQQYEDGIPHNESAIAPAKEILEDTGFSEEEIDKITYAILHHRKGPPDEHPYAKLLFEADKLARPCFFCDAQADCHRDNRLKNLTPKH